MGTGRSVYGHGKARLQDDLTERIYVAYYRLQRAGTRNVRGLITKALKRHGLKTQAKTGTARTWGSAEVAERIRQFKDRIVRRMHVSQGPERSKHIVDHRNQMVDGWIEQFHSALRVEREWRRARQQR